MNVFGYSDRKRRRVSTRELEIIAPDGPYTLPTTQGNSGDVITRNGATASIWTAPGGVPGLGDLVGPPSSMIGEIPIYDAVNGKLLGNTGVNFGELVKNPIQNSTVNADPPRLDFFKNRNMGPVLTGDGIGTLQFTGNDGVSAFNGASIDALADQDWAGGLGKGAQIQMNIVPNGLTTKKLVQVLTGDRIENRVQTFHGEGSSWDNGIDNPVNIDFVTGIELNEVPLEVKDSLGEVRISLEPTAGRVTADEVLIEGDLIFSDGTSGDDRWALQDVNGTLDLIDLSVAGGPQTFFRWATSQFQRWRYGSSIGGLISLYNRAGGTQAAPTAVGSNVRSHEEYARFYDGAGFGAGHLNYAATSQPWTPGNHGARWTVEGVDDNTASFVKRLVLETNGMRVRKKILVAPDLDVAVGQDSAVLEIQSTTGGFLLPKMTTLQRDAIVFPSTGLQVFNLTTNEIEFWNGAIWESNSGTGAHNDLQQAYDAGDGTITLSNFSKPFELVGADAVTPVLRIVEPGVANGPGFQVDAFGDIRGASILHQEYGSGLGAQSLFRKARGTPLAPLPVQSSDNVASINFEGFGTSFQPCAAIEVKAAEGFNVNQNGSELIFKVTPLLNSSTTPVEALTIGQSQTNGFGDTRVRGDLICEQAILSPGSNLTLQSPTLVGPVGTIDASAAFEIDSVVSGLLPPRMSTVQRDAIVAAADGLVIYNTTTQRLEYRGPGSWQPMGRFVQGPELGASDNAIAVYDGVSGSLVRDSKASIDAQGNLKTISDWPFGGRPWTTIFSLNTAVDVIGTAVETDIFDAGVPLPANSISSGAMLRWNISGYQSNNAGHECTIRIYMWNNVIELVSDNIGGGALDQYNYQGTLCFRGASAASLVGTGQQQFFHFQTPSNENANVVDLTTGFFNTTLPGANFRATVQWNIAAANVVNVNNFSLELLQGQ